MNLENPISTQMEAKQSCILQRRKELDKGFAQRNIQRSIENKQARSREKAESQKEFNIQCAQDYLHSQMERNILNFNQVVRTKVHQSEQRATKASKIKGRQVVVNFPLERYMQID